MRFIDSHCHLDFDVLSSQLDAVLDRANAVGVDTFLVPGVKLTNWTDVLSLAERHPNILPALGLHPYFLDEYHESDISALEQYLSLNKNVVAIGECGLDKMVSTDFKLQITVLERQLSLAKVFNLPVLLHCRKAHNELIQILQRFKLSAGGVIHGFSGSKELALQYVKLGFKLGIGGVITYPSANKTRQAVSLVPLRSLILETDSPDMPIYQQSCKYNEPANVKTVAKALSVITNSTVEEVSGETCCGFYELFSKK